MCYSCPISQGALHTLDTPIHTQQGFYTLPSSALSPDKIKPLRKPTPEQQLKIDAFEFMYDSPPPEGVAIELDDIATNPIDVLWSKYRNQTQVAEMVLHGDAKFQKVGERLENCSGLLLFGWNANGLHLKRAWFCRFKFCPVCQWRKSMLYKALAFQRLPAIVEQYPKNRWLFLTLTVKNCDIGDLKSTLGEMMKGWKRLSQRKDLSHIDGWIRAVEVTRNAKTNQAHPHIHVLLFVKPSYFKRGYISHKKWTELWRDTMRLDYDPIVNIKSIKERKKNDVFDYSVSPENATGLSPAMLSALAETLKYGVKVSDIIGDGTDPVANDFFKQLIDQTDHLRFSGSGGVLAGILKKTVGGKPDDDKQEPTSQDLTSLGGGDTENDTDDRRLAFSYERYDLKKYIYNPKLNDLQSADVPSEFIDAPNINLINKLGKNKLARPAFLDDPKLRNMKI